MRDEKLPNYVRANRKRLGLSQGEAAFLLGCRFGTKVSRYERFLREPSLRTALALEVALRVPMRELFPGIREEVGREVLRRGRLLKRRLERRQSNPLLRQKLATLQAIVAPPPVELSYEPFDDL